MKKLTMVVFFDQRLKSGGNFQQSLNNILLTKHLENVSLDIKYVTNLTENKNFLKKYKIDAIVYSPGIFSKLSLRFWIKAPFFIYRFLRKFFKHNHFEFFLKKLNTDIVYFISQSQFVNYLESINYIFTLFDLCHLDYPEFPEVSNYREFENREYFFKKNLQRAVAVFVDSELGKKNALSRYNLNPERVFIFKFSASNNISSKRLIENNLDFDIKKKYNILFDFIYYPAQFWAHKNHIYILNAIKILELSFGIKLAVIFSGSDFGNLKYIKKVTKNLELEERVKFVGFIPNDEIYFHYRQSLALVMPTFFGPTNLPPLEAFEISVPVIYSDLDGLRDQVGDAALLMDLDNPESLANHLNNLVRSDFLRKNLIEKGQNRIKQLNKKEENLIILNSVLNKFKIIRSCWE